MTYAIQIPNGEIEGKIVCSVVKDNDNYYFRKFNPITRWEVADLTEYGLTNPQSTFEGLLNEAYNVLGAGQPIEVIVFDLVEE